MKRQSEELFFKNNTKPNQDGIGKNGININLPSDYSPIPGDIIEIFISEDQNNGYISYYAKLLVFKSVYTSTVLYDITPITGKLSNSGGLFVQLDGATLNIVNGVKIVTLNAPAETVVLFDASANYVTNLIVHRSKASIDLYLI